MRKLSGGHGFTFAVVGVLAVLVSFGRSVPAVDNLDGDAGTQAAQLSRDLGQHVLPDSLVWIEASSAVGLKAAIVWQELLFLASLKPKGSADLYRVEVRLDNRGNIIAERGLRNLTNSPAGDEFDIVALPPLAVVATRALAQVRSFTIFDFRGQPLSGDREWSSLGRLMARVTDFRKTGHIGGIGKTTVRFVHPPKHVELNVTEQGGKKQIEVKWTDRQGQSKKSLISHQGNVTEDEALLALSEVRLPKQPILWLVDTVRSLSFVGPGPIEWAEGRFFSMRDTLRRLRYKLTGEETQSDSEDDIDDEPAKQKIALPAGLEVGKVTPHVPWPPPKVPPPVFKRVARGEGTWHKAVPGFVRTLPGAPPFIYKTYTRPDRQRPYVKVRLYAMDMRQLKLHMVAGHEDPRPTTGSLGTGKIPRRQEILSRLVVAFNGAFKTEHGAYGMMVERDLLLPPQKNAATIASLENGQAVMGSWPEGMPIPKEMVSMRQNMDPLVENGAVNPRRRYLWGFTLDEDITNMNTIRSGVCLTETGTLIYAWGEDLTAVTLGTAMNAAGCVYGLHLDMNPFHTSYIYYRFEDDVDTKKPEFKAKLALSEMRFSPYRYVNGAPKDFFFLTLKDRSPGPDWSARDLAQPAPGFIPAVFKRSVDSCTLIAIDMTRARAELVPGEIPSHLAPPQGIPSDENTRQHMLVNLVLGPWSSGRGQLVNGTVVATLSPEQASIGLSEAGRLQIGMWPLDTQNGTRTSNAVQSTWLMPGPVSSEALTACGWFDNTWLIIGQGPGQELARIMQKQGVKTAIAFNTKDAVAVRSEHGITDINGNPITALPASSTTLRIVANPRPLGATRLENVFNSSSKD